MKNYFYEIRFSRLVLIIFVAVIFIVTGFTNQPPAPRFVGAPTLNSATLMLPNGQLVTAEVADTQPKRTQGLSGRASLPDNSGMLFVFEESDYHNFWMPNMNFSLDIIWLDEDYQIVDIRKNVPPLAEAGGIIPSYTNKVPATYVLEVNAGFSDEHNLAPGDVFRLT